MIFTFYSYKGGVGRSLALAHVAYAFAERGLRVLAVDFDLEAPGLERYCFTGRESVQTAREHEGLVDLIMAYRRTLTSKAEFEARAFRDWKQYIMTVRNPVNSEGGHLDLMTAGRRASPEQLRDYSLTVRTFDWLDFFHNWHGDAFFKWLRDEWTRADIGYDVVLVDSRTGVTEMGGVCAYQLADVATLMCAPNEQNLEGTLEVMRDFGSLGVLALRGGRPLKLLAVPSRVEQNHPLRDDFLKRFAELLGPLPLGPDIPVTYADITVPYLPAFAIAEPVVGGSVENASDANREAFTTLSTSIQKLADALTLFSDRSSRLGQQSAGALAALSGQTRSNSVTLTADTSRRSSGYDFYIDHGLDDAKDANVLAQVLRDRGLEVFIDSAIGPNDEAWATEEELAFNYSSCILICFGKASTSGPRNRLLKSARSSSRQVELIPVLLPRGSKNALHSFGFEDHQVVDLRNTIDAEAVEPLMAVRRRMSGTSSRRKVDIQDNPYRGIMPYCEDDARFFAGRDDEIEHLIACLADANVVWVDGASKVGKTSLVLAGLLPALRTRVSKSKSRIHIRVHDATTGQAWPRWRDPKAAAGTTKDQSLTELIVIDHIDDFSKEGIDDARPFRVAALQRLLVGSGARRKLLILSRCSDLVDVKGAANTQVSEGEARRFTLRRLEGEAWRRAINRPVQQAGHLLENGLLERLAEAAGSAHSAILQVQLALVGLWQLRRDGWLTNRSLDGFGHLAGVFKRHIDACLSALDKGDRQAAVALFETLCHVEFKDGEPLSKPLLWSQARTPAAIDSVGAERLRDLLAANGLVDVWHDGSDGSTGAGLKISLARSDARIYFDDATWVADVDFMIWRGRMSQASAHWSKDGKQPGALWSGSALVDASRWHMQRRRSLTEAELDFIETSLDALRLRSPSSEIREMGISTVHGSTVEDAVDKSHPPLRINVLNGHLHCVAGPLMVGHYRSMRLNGTEAYLDRQLGGTLSETLASGMYPDRPGTHIIVDNNELDQRNPLTMSKPATVIVVALGDEGYLRSADLIQGVREAVLSLVARKPPGMPKGVVLSTMLMGSDATGVSAASSAKLITQGVLEANYKARASGYAIIEELQFIELFHDRATEAWLGLFHQFRRKLHLVNLGFGVTAGSGALRRALASKEVRTGYNVISASSQITGGVITIDYVIDTSQARTEVRNQKVESKLLQRLVAKASNEVESDPTIGRALFLLVMPAEVERFLGDDRLLVLDVDAGIAVLPWEIIYSSVSGSYSDTTPWVVQSKFVRNLRIEGYPSSAIRTATTEALVVGAPLAKSAQYPPLPGARVEAAAVARLLSEPSRGLGTANVHDLSDGIADAYVIINAMLYKPYRIMHFCGHGSPGPAGGVVLADTLVVRAQEIKSLNVIPELVFVDTGHLPTTPPSGNRAANAYDRVAFAASLAGDLLLAGVRCVVCAGWAVESGPAVTFASAFYTALLQGRCFGDAVGAARHAAWLANPNGLTWAAYQCYGDPYWILRDSVNGVDLQLPPSAHEFDELASPVDLALALETIAVNSRSDVGHSSRMLGRINVLETRYAFAWGQIGAVAEAFGLSYAEAFDLDKAIHWYQRALGASDGTASLRAAEQLGSLLALRGARHADPLRRRADLEAAISHLDRLLALQPTPEREMLLGSAWNRLASTPAESRETRTEVQAIRAAALHYGNAERVARNEGRDFLAEASRNAIRAELQLALIQGDVLRLNSARVEATEVALSNALHQAPDFWSVIATIDFRVLVLCAEHGLSRESDALVRQYRDLHARIHFPPLWDSVYLEAAFTLERYAKKASPAERGAAIFVIQALRQLSGQ